MPLLTFIVTRRYRRSERRACTLLLSGNYKLEFWWFESYEMLRKLLLASVVLVVWPNTSYQLWFGSLISVATLAITIQNNP